MTKQTIQKIDALVIGATGFIGNHLMHTLLDAGKTVRILVRPGKKHDELKKLPVEISYGCLEDKESILHAAQGVTIIYNCAGLSSDWAANKTFADANITGVENILNALEHSAAKRLIHISTSDVYGYPKVPCDENQEISDIGLPYNHSKVEGERVIWQAVKERHLPVTVFRPASVYGPSSMEWVIEISKLLLSKDMVLLNGGKSEAGLIYVENLTRLMMISATLPIAVGKCYNIRDSGSETWKDFVNELGKCFVKDKWGYYKLPSSLAYPVAYLMEFIYGALRIKSRPLLTRHAVHLLSRNQGFDISRAQQELGFESWISFEQGMQLTRNWLTSEEGKNCLLGEDQSKLDVYI
jgi:nucleoside-diphosphate-sugar epimerase